VPSLIAGPPIAHGIADAASCASPRFYLCGTQQHGIAETKTFESQKADIASGIRVSEKQKCFPGGSHGPFLEAEDARCPSPI